MTYKVSKEARVLDMTYPTHCLLAFHPVIGFQAPKDMDDLIMIGTVFPHLANPTVVCIGVIIYIVGWNFLSGSSRHAYTLLFIIPVYSPVGSG